MRFTGRGHPAIRATHPKTFELVAGDELSERGTCVVAVAAEAHPPSPMAGPVRIRISAGGLHVSIDAVANSSWDPDGPVVVRRSPVRLPGTFATSAGLGAADLPRPFVEALRDPDVLVTVDVVSVPDEHPVIVLFAADPSEPDDPRLRAELDAADAVEAQDADARRLVPPRVGAGSRRLVVAAHGLPRLERDEPGSVVEVVGLAPLLAVGAATIATGPLVVLDPGDDVRDALRRLPGAARIATTVSPDRLPALLELAAAVRGSSRCRAGQAFGPISHSDTESLPVLFGREPVFVCFESVADVTGLDPAVRATVQQLLADGVPTKTVATALATLTGMPHRAAYDVALGLRP